MKISMLAGLAMLGLLTACGGGGGGGGTPPERESGSARGVAHDGPIRGGDVSAYRWDNGSKGELVGTALTDSEGRYEIEITSNDGPLLLEITGGSYTEEASDRNVSLGPNDKLTGLIFYESGSIIDAQLTHYTTWAACLADYLLDSSTITVGNAVTQANETMSNLAGVPITATEPLDITVASNVGAFLTPNHQYGYLLAAISGVTADISEANNVLPHSGTLYTSIRFASLVCDDIRHDGLMDGIGEPNPSNPTGQIFVGVEPINPEYYRTVLAQNILAIADDPINQAGFTPRDLLDYANNISLNGNNIYGSTVPVAVDVDGPTVIPATAQGTTLGGEFNLAFAVDDPLGVETINFFLDGVFFQSGDIASPVMNLLTFNFADGAHEIRVVATDVLGNETTQNFSYDFLNSGPVINITSSSLTRRASYDIAGTISSSIDIDRVEISVDGGQAINATVNSTEGIWNSTLSLSPGFNEIVVTAFDRVNNSTETNITVGLDVLAPSILIETTNVRFTTFEGQLNLCTVGELDSENSLVTPICLSAERITLDGRPVTGGLTNEDFVLAGFQIGDSTGSGVYTENEGLITEYRYSRDGGDQVVVDWTVAPRQNGFLNDRVYVPLVTEYLGNQFFNTDFDEEHLIEMRVTDEAGNTTTRDFRLRIDVLTPLVSINTTIDSSVFSAPFANRNLLQGQLVTAVHTIDNDSSINYIMQFSPSNNHVMTQNYEGIIRENRGQFRVTEHWYNLERETPFFDVSRVGRDRVTPPTAYLENNIIDYYENNPIRESTELETFQVVGGDYVFSSSRWFDSNRSAALVVSGCEDDPNSAPRLIFSNPYNQINCSYANNARRNHSYDFVATSGYPRNVITDYTDVNPIVVESITISNITTGQNLAAFEGWYRIPAQSIVQVRVAYRLPFFSQYNSLSVVNDDDNISYQNQTYLDEILTWSFDNDLTISRAIDPFSTDLFDSVSATVQQYDARQANFSIERDI